MEIVNFFAAEAAMEDVGVVLKEGAIMKQALLLTRWL